MKPEYDEHSKQQTTGHEWDGIKELNTPVPTAFRLWFWSFIAIGLVLSILYPTWPFIVGIGNYTKGLLGHSSRTAVDESVASGAAQRREAFAPFYKLDINELAQDESLRAEFEPAISVLYQDNCAACHAADLKGQKGFPNLADDHWMWSGTPEEIETTLKVGINSTHEDTRLAEMPAFGRDELLDSSDINDVLQYVLNISGQYSNKSALGRGETLFEENCSSCHASGGVGGSESGAPSLVDEAWVYGSSREDILETLNNGRKGHMPHWSGRISDEEIKMLALYVYWASQDHAK